MLFFYLRSEKVLMDGGRTVRFLDWWGLLGLEGDASVTEIRRMGIVETDGGPFNIPSLQKCCRDFVQQVARDGEGSG
jgi:hypothetical protein